MLCIGYAKSVPDEGFASAERNPSPGFASRSHPLPQGERVRGTCRERYGVMEIGEKSTNQLFGCTNPLIFGLIARGATSWAT
jgi:hypothetical protein